jgi:4-hydroxy-tetrahydrodipicolinate reductase
MNRIGINGAAGRMGQLLCARVLGAEDLHLEVATDLAQFSGKDVGEMVGMGPRSIRLTCPEPGGYANCDVVVDFSLAEGTTKLLTVLGNQALVVGTTGLTEASAMELGHHARRNPVVLAANFSTGVNVLLSLVEQAARLLPDYDMEIVEMHHSRKRDAPSGTALALAKAAADARGVDPSETVVYGRVGDAGPRPKGEIGVHAIRGGDIAGEHRVFLCGPGERLELGHVATSRAAFADGALRAARWLKGQPPGLYSMQDVLGLK